MVPSLTHNFLIYDVEPDGNVTVKLSDGQFLTVKTVPQVNQLLIAVDAALTSEGV